MRIYYINGNESNCDILGGVIDTQKFDQMLNYYGYKKCENCSKYSDVGETFDIDTKEYSGTYWYYVGESFIIDIQDLYFNEDYITSLNNKRIRNLENAYLMCNYLISANGESFEPYSSVTSDTIMMIASNENSKRVQRFSFHKNSHFYYVGIRFSDEYLEHPAFKYLDIKYLDYEKIFLDSKGMNTKPISKLADKIINCNLTGDLAREFLKEKASEWFSITLNVYNYIKERKKEIHRLDIKPIKNVQKYIDDHYALDISQSFLEKIAMMSGTKLKSTFKKYFNQTITEYTQRKRMNIAENLILSTDLDMASIAKTVGYNSPSRFSTLFKRYKGIYPKDVRVKSLNQDNKH